MAHRKHSESGREKGREIMSKGSSRREFLGDLGRGAAGLAAGAFGFSLLSQLAPGVDAPTTGSLTTAAPKAAGAAAAGGRLYDLAAIRGESPAAICRAAVEAIGGMKRFVKKGDIVVVKPNIGWDRTPEQAGNTNPDVVAELVRMALDAGAAKVKVFDNTCANPRSAYVHSGIETAAKQAGAIVLPFDDKRCKTMPIKDGEFLKEWPVFVEAIEADCYINVPVAKVHGISKVTLGMKNAMGVIGGNRGHWHRQIHAAVVDFLAVIKPQLTVIDAWRVMHRNGPTGGSPDDVTVVKTCIASADPVAADARAAALFNLKPEDLPFVIKAAQRGYGQMDLSKVAMFERV